MSAIRRPWAPALRRPDPEPRPILIYLHPGLYPERTHVYRMLRHPGAATWTFVREILPPKEEEKAKGNGKAKGKEKKSATRE